MTGVQREIDDRTWEYANIKADEYIANAEDRAHFCITKPQIMGKSHDEGDYYHQHNLEKRRMVLATMENDYNQAEKQNNEWAVYNCSAGRCPKGKVRWRGWMWQPTRTKQNYL